MLVVVLVYLKFAEGRTKLLGKESAMGRRRREREEARVAEEKEKAAVAEQASS